MSTLDNYERVLAAIAIWREARNQPKEAMSGVWWVIKNRVADHRWPSTIAGVILQPWQFSSFNKGEVNASLFPAVSDPSFRRCSEVVDAPALEAADPTAGSNMYHSFKTGDAHWPGWATGEHHTVDIGAFHFYRI